MEIRERLRALRLERKETQKAVAEAIGINERHYQFFEYGTHLPNLENFYALADHFDVSMDYLAGRTDRRETLR